MSPRRWLYKIRAWVDRQVPRDVLIVTVRVNNKTVLRIDHMNALLCVAMNGGIYAISGTVKPPVVGDGEYDSVSIEFTKEHLQQ
jgi:hypothetical protein